MKDCESCAYSKRKLSMLGFRTWCWKYKQFRTMKCIDWVGRNARDL
jgi:hypothetical protein